MHVSSDPIVIVPHADALLATLFVELFQTEQSAREHPAVEADRLAGTPPAEALLAVVAHAERVRPELEALAEREQLATTSVGARIGDALSIVRDFIVDRTVSREKSYRGTLIGMRHGVDLVRLVVAVAEAAGRPAIVDWCRRWLEVRPGLVERVVERLYWFAAHPDRARERATRVAKELGDAPVG